MDGPSGHRPSCDFQRNQTGQTHFFFFFHLGGNVTSFIVHFLIYSYIYSNVKNHNICLDIMHFTEQLHTLHLSYCTSPCWVGIIFVTSTLQLMQLIILRLKEVKDFAHCHTAQWKWGSQTFWFQIQFFLPWMKVLHTAPTHEDWKCGWS